jgi:hypothetical protein
MINATHDYEPLDGDTVVYRGKQWVVIANETAPGGGELYHHDRCWFTADRLGERQPNWEAPHVQYSLFSHYARKGFDFEDLATAYRVACSYFEVDTRGWLNREIEYARAVCRWQDAFRAVDRELFPPPGAYAPLRAIAAYCQRIPAIRAELARRGYVRP